MSTLSDARLEPPTAAAAPAPRALPGGVRESEGAAVRAGAGTVISAPFDLAFFVLPPLGTVAFLLTQGLVPAATFALCALVWIALAQSHFGATLLFYLDPESRRVYARSPLVYAAVPLLCVGGAATLGLTRFAWLPLVAVPLVSFWHGNRQSAGVCGLYRGISRSFDPATRRLEMVTIFLASGAFTAWGAIRLGLLAPLARAYAPARAWVETPLRAAAAAALATAALLLVVAELRALAQSRAAGVAAWPRMCVLATSTLMYAPYLLARDALSAYLAALIPHYLQYHGLLWLVNRNKVDASVVPEGALLRAVVRSPASYAASTIGFALALGAALAVSQAFGRIEAGLALVAGVNLAHFWLDGFFWRFRDPEARRATLRHIHPRLAGATSHP